MPIKYSTSQRLAIKKPIIKNPAYILAGFFIDTHHKFTSSKLSACL